MANIVFNIAKGRIAYFAESGVVGSGLVAVPLESAGLVDDPTMVDYATLADILAGASNESAVGRMDLTNVTRTVDNANDRVDLDADNIVWLSAPASEAVGAIVICYVPDTGTSTDADVIPMTKHDITWTPDGNDFTLNIDDFARAQGV